MSVLHSLRQTFVSLSNTKLSFAFALLASLFILAEPGQAAHAATVSLPAGGDLQAALNAAQPGDTIILEAGATYRGPFDLPYKNGDAYITIQSSRLAELPEGVRVGPAQAALMPKILSPSYSYAVKAVSGAHHYRFVGVEFTMVDQTAYSYAMIVLGATGALQDTPEEVPHHLVIDRCYVHAAQGQPLKRGIELNSAHTEVTNSYVAGFKVMGQEAQAVGGWNGPGPFLIENNYLEGAGSNLLFGGADPSIPNLVPSDIRILRNHFSKPLRWRAEGWTVKNILELKNARRVRIEGNLFENNWLNAQTGEAILFTPRNQDGTAPWSTVEDVEFISNHVRNVASAFLILGRDYNHPSQETKRVRVANNLFENVSREFGGRGAFLVYSTPGGEEITFERNTVLHAGTLIAVGDTGKAKGFRFVSNVARHNEYNLHGSGVGGGSRMFNTFFDGWEWQGNVIIGAAAASLYPPGTDFAPSLEELFVDAASGDYRIKPSSPYAGVGCDFEALVRAMRSPAPSPTPTPTPAPTPTPTPTPIPTPTPTPSTYLSPVLIAQASLTATTLGSTTSSGVAEMTALAANIEQAQAVFAGEASNFASATQIDKTLRAALYFTRAAAALAAAETPSTAAQNRLLITALRLQQAGALMQGASASVSVQSSLSSTPDIGPADTRSSASLAPAVSPLSLGTVFGNAGQSPLAPQEAYAVQAANGSLPYELGGASVSVGGVAAMLASVSPARVNFVVPAGVAHGQQEVIVTSQDGFVSRGTLNVTPLAPALFTAAGTGGAVALNGATFEAGPFAVTTAAALGADKRTRVMLFATGFRAAANADANNDVRRSDGSTVANLAESVVVEARTSGGRVFSLPVEYAGAQGRFPGLDQITVMLVPELQAAGSVELKIIVGGQTSNTATITVQ